MFPDKDLCIEAALRIYEGTGSVAEKRLVDSEATSFFHFASEQINAIRGASQPA